MAHKTLVLNIVGLSESLLGDRSPNLNGIRKRSDARRLEPVLPAVTCSVQSSMLTGLPPSGTGIVGNGWYNRQMSEVHFWKQSNPLVGGEKVWETARKRDPNVTTANLFWWYNMYATVDSSVTPRPIYKADGRKIPDVYAEPPDLRDRLQSELGTFPLFKFWGPASSIESSQWIAEAAERVRDWTDPTLELIYLPHLDYALQKVGPDHPSIPDRVAEIDQVAGGLIERFEEKGYRVIVLSEYGIGPVEDSVHINKILRGEGFLRVREEEGLELLDAGAGDAFAVADHQIAHVYLKDSSRVPEVESLLKKVAGVEAVLDRRAQAEAGIDHDRAGDLVLVSTADRWFSYDYWLDDDRAPDFARTVAIHNKPGYDPLELFLDPEIAFPKLKIAGKLIRKKLGMRTLLDVIPLDTSLVRGSHGRVDAPKELTPVLFSPIEIDDPGETVSCLKVRDLILDCLFRD